jgi:hypothetical protein
MTFLCKTLSALYGVEPNHLVDDVPTQRHPVNPPPVQLKLLENWVVEELPLWFKVFEPDIALAESAKTAVKMGPAAKFLPHWYHPPFLLRAFFALWHLLI